MMINSESDMGVSLVLCGGPQAGFAVGTLRVERLPVRDAHTIAVPGCTRRQQDGGSRVTSR